jgi:CDGSH-type Zn-finger protein
MLYIYIYIYIYIYHFHEVIRNDDSPQPPVENRTLLQRPLAQHSQQKPFDDGDHGKQELR